MTPALFFLVRFAALGAAGPSDNRPVVEPFGELAARTELVENRFTRGDVPRFTEDFILADLALRPEYPRRFSEYSGDLSGRYIGARALLSPKAGEGLARLVADAVRYQKPDGRFGNEGLRFVPEEIGGDHMALLWGNGRLLVGLLEFQSAQPNPAALEAARRLGDFIVAAHPACANEAVVKRVEALGAAGIICYTQLIEGLVMLANATGDGKYLGAAEGILPWFPTARGQQHSHGYLTTLRAVLLLFEATQKPEHLALVEKLYGDLTASNDLQVYGGVREYFGGKGDRDEGCSEGDFVRLSLRLWRLTSNSEYLERAEHCLLNQFFANQFSTGDFGHHAYAQQGMMPVEGVGRAWWCCTMHGARTLRDVLDSIVTRDGELLRLNLFCDARWSDRGQILVLQRNVTSGAGPDFTVTVEQAAPASPQAAPASPQAAANGVRLAVRQPTWAERVALTVNGEPAETAERNGYLAVTRTLKAGDRLEARIAYRICLLTRDGKTLAPADLTGKPVEAALKYGPWLLGVAEVRDPLFFGEPWTENQVLLPSAPKAGAANDGPPALPCAQIPATYTHGGFPGNHAVTLRPLSECTAGDNATFAVFLQYRKAD